MPLTLLWGHSPGRCSQGGVVAGNQAQFAETTERVLADISLRPRKRRRYRKASPLRARCSIVSLIRSTSRDAVFHFIASVYGSTRCCATTSWS